MTGEPPIAAGAAFRVGLGRGADWRAATAAAVVDLGAIDGGATVGFVYATDHFAADLQGISDQLTEATAIADWIGTVGFGVIAGGRAVYDEPGIALMTARIAPDRYTLFDCVAPTAEPGAVADAPPTALVHVDPRNAKASDLVAEIARSSGAYLIGGLTASRSARFDQLAGVLTDGGVSGAVFQPGVVVATGLTQGCAPIGPVRTITLAQDNLVMEIDGAPALDALRADLAGWPEAPPLRSIGASVFAGFPVPHSDTGDYLVRNIVGIDSAKGWLAVAEPVEPRRPVLFCRRDRQAAESDLAQMAARVRGRAPAARGGIYVSCLARGPNTFASAEAEVAILQKALGNLPLVGFFANGEISNDRIYGYTGVLALF